MNQLIVYLLTGYTSSKNMHIQVTSSWTARTSTDSFPSTKLSWTREKTVHCGTEKKKKKRKRKKTVQYGVCCLYGAAKDVNISVDKRL